MNRRGFIGLFAAAAPAALLLPELLVPKRTIFLPPRGGWLAHTNDYTYRVTAMAYGGTPPYTWSLIPAIDGPWSISEGGLLHVDTLFHV